MRYKTYLTLATLLILLIWFSVARPSFIDGIRPKIVDLAEFPLKVSTKAIRVLYNLATFQNEYEKKIALLEKRIATLSKENIQMKELIEENERLRKLFLFRSKFGSKGIAAEVIARGQSSWDTFIIIDKGKKDGITPNMPVAKSDGLAGRVFEVGESTAKIMLIDNPNSKISATIQRTREQGVLVGLSSGLCKLIYLDRNTEAQPGDIVIASELRSSSAKGLLIGKVIRVLKNTNSLYASAVVKPSSNLFNIEEVLCLE